MERFSTVQKPKFTWQPLLTEQYAEEAPQKLCSEQHDPKFEFMQEADFALPHDASVLVVMGVSPLRMATLLPD